jgi:hypothetical protein
LVKCYKKLSKLSALPKIIMNIFSAGLLSNGSRTDEDKQVRRGNLVEHW